ncbi:hypothetical protein HOG17_03945 [Candidatus Peregrinibacteria bacterium]|jgi:hypothetical protein|nr:hypothetical protein [Candidatus Peregrinibacteria bacterium]MBT4148356.1 hypothetical protein [Candidatus Peregrinibacteria bacterium]MBT4366677.1 hypothetical protein [Candidatus Peregrinibacteria bacterium]MBT4455891.1 hypothetical protein [Candidatus Peregrinibacteria bacterium]
MKTLAEIQKGFEDTECETCPIPNGADLTASAQCKMMRLATEQLALAVIMKDRPEALRWKRIQQDNAMELNCEPGMRRF